MSRELYLSVCYHYFDSERLDITSTTSIYDSVNTTLSDGTVLYDWKEYSILEIPSSSDDSDVSFAIPDSLLAMGCQKLREELLRLGEDPGPIRADTRMLYVRRLARLQSGITDTKVGLYLMHKVINLLLIQDTHSCHFKL
jgi:hypothetical protein